MALAPTADTDICNMAMILVKQDPEITSIVNPKSSTEMLCAEWFHAKRLSLLRSHPWNFAIKRILITADVVNPPAFGFDVAFTLPKDFVRYLNRYDASGIRIAKNIDRYELENNQILINGDGTNEIRIRMIYDHTEVEFWDDLFIELMAVELAIKLAPNFAGGKGLMSELKAERKDLQQQARAIDGQERPPIRTQSSKWIASRRRASSRGEVGPIIIFPN